MRWPGMFSFLSVSLIDWEEQVQRCSDNPVSLPNASNLFVHSDRRLGFGSVALLMLCSFIYRAVLGGRGLSVVCAFGPFSIIVTLGLSGASTM